MGLLAKAATKNRVQPISGPVNAGLTAGTPWLTNGGIPAGALIRSAVFALNLTGSRSSAVRGSTSPLVTLLLDRSFTSQLWVETTDFKVWSFVLGISRGEAGIAADWAVKLTISETTATVGTTNWLTKDDVLVHGDYHDALRTELLRSLALGKQADAGSEAEMTNRSLALSQPFAEPAPPAFDLNFAISTSINPATARAQLKLLGHQVLHDAPTFIRWGLGLPQNHREDHVTLTFTPHCLTGAAHIAASSDHGRRIAATALRRFIGRALFLLQRDDVGAAYVGPSEWKP